MFEKHFTNYNRRTIGSIRVYVVIYMPAGVVHT